MPPRITEFEGLPVRDAKLKLRAGKYVLQIGATTKEVPAEVASQGGFDKLLGDVGVAMSGRRVVAIVPRRPPFRCVLCYYPAPDFLRRIQDMIRKEIAQELVRDKVVSEQFVAAFR